MSEETKVEVEYIEMDNVLVCIADGRADSQGGILVIDQVDLPEGEAIVTYNFQGPEIGRAKLFKQGKAIRAKIRLDKASIPVEILKSLKPAIGGSSHRDEDGKLSAISIVSIGLAEENADERIPTLEGVLETDLGEKDT